MFNHGSWLELEIGPTEDVAATTSMGVLHSKVRYLGQVSWVISFRSLGTGGSL